ncbi:allophanate hydrolase [Ancylobacter amanitiformis]|uniref:Allophanate hydrolase n=1 Tax=Ancylobacter amanitiformis TaxID=217069 RepID=A0ABU0LX37_9HYPH|nr:allophanate hydrolase [Ancylobacter amanitiformis]MDQ0513271.1 allophanate hydrolase [Ancylobacter amanitiformis]
MIGTIAEIVAAHRSGRVRPAETVARCLSLIERQDDPAIFTTLAEAGAIASALKQLEGADPANLPLYGVPFAVKDNIDVAGLPTTCACPEFAYDATRDAAAVARLRRAGAIVIGKTNLDQFATGLNGTRSPYGTPRNAVRADLVPGGSSSGSAVAVAAGLVPFALGTDTAGSGRVPAGLNNIVGLKPSLGLVSTRGVVPACRSLDCVSVFALTVADALAATRVMAAPDDADPFSRALPLAPAGSFPARAQVGVPRAQDRISFGDRLAEAAFRAAVGRMARLGATIVEIDMEPFFETARLLYEGPWVAERLAAVGGFLEARPQAFHPVVRAIIEQGRGLSAVDAFRGQYRLAELRVQAREALTGLDALMVPTMPTVFTVEQMQSEPVKFNSQLGVYTNFVNLLDMCALAVPSEIRPDGAPAGITLLAPAGRDAHLAALGLAFHADTGLSLGATGASLPVEPTLPRRPAPGFFEVALFGAHLSGLPLNGEVIESGGVFVREARTTGDYRLYLLPEGRVRRPGLLRGRPGAGAAIACEIWALPAAAFGKLVAGIPGPLGVGTVHLDDGSDVKGFLMEAAAAEAARDITVFGGWRNFLADEAARRADSALANG